MYKEHPVFKKPEDENSKIWRYMDFTKFVSLIDKNILFFTRVDYLDDNFEGSFSRVFIAPKLYPKRMSKEQIPQWLEKTRRDFSFLNNALRRSTAVNCWHINEYESAAMWKLYLKSDEGIAIQSTYRRLTESFDDYKDNDVWVGVVNYIDYEKEPMPQENIYSPFICKRKSFEHEKELRAVIVNRSKSEFPVVPLHIPDDLPKYYSLEEISSGLEVPVNVEKLIENIYVSPTAKSWFKDLVISVLKNMR